MRCWQACGMGQVLVILLQPGQGMQAAIKSDPNQVSHDTIELCSAFGAQPVCAGQAR